jgi:AcrR family transcriptional regulator
MAATAPQRRTYLDGDERRAQILAVAGQLFSERHYDAVSTAEVARAAGIARGLVHHYFGTKRELYLEVVRSMLRVPADPFATSEGGPQHRVEALGVAVDRWLSMTRRNRGTWLALVGAQGFGHDPEIEAVLAAARERMIDQLIALAWGPPEQAPAELRALLAGYAGFAEAITADWLSRGRPSRRVVYELLLHGLLALVDDALPEIQQALLTEKPRRT